MLLEGAFTSTQLTTAVHLTPYGLTQRQELTAVYLSAATAGITTALMPSSSHFSSFSEWGGESDPHKVVQGPSLH